MNADAKPIMNPWLIAHQPEAGGNIQTLIFSQDRDHREFGLLIADVIRHVARAFNVDEAEVMEWVEKELARPTTKIEGGTLQ